MKKNTLKQQIIDYYCRNSEKKELKINEIAVLFNVKESYVSRCLKDYRLKHKELIEEKVKKLYFEDGHTINDIAEIVEISVPTVRKLLKSDINRFNMEVEKRKVENLTKRKSYKKEYNKVIREEKKFEEEFIKNEMKRLQAINARSMSIKPKMTDLGMVAYHKRHYKITNTRQGNKVLVINDNMKHLISKDMPMRLDLGRH